MYYKTYESRYGLMVAAADKELVGKKFKYNNTEFFVNPRFYKEKEGGEEEVLRVLKEAYSANFVGKKAVELGIKAGLLKKENVIQITKGVPHGQFIVIQI